MRTFFIVPLLVASLASAAIIDPARTPTDGAWATAGVAGGIPSRTTIFQTLSSGATEAQIQTAINACPTGQVVKLGAGNFVLTTSGLTMKSGVTLRGSGVSTHLQYTGTNGFTMIGTPGATNGSKVAITSSVTKGTTSFTTGSTTGISTGSYVAISHTNPAWVTARSYGGTNGNVATWLANGNYTTAMVQIVKVTSVSGNTVNFAPAAYLDMPNSPQYQIMAMSSGIGIEDMVVEKTQTAGGGVNVRLGNTAGSWVSGVVIKWPQATGILVQNSFGCTVRNCAVDSTNFAIDHESGRSYAIFFFDYNSNHLVENNVVMGARHALVFEGGGSGIVMAHNASMKPRNNDTGDYGTITEDEDTHGAHPYMNLFEGNVVSRIVRDNTWGSSSHNLDFRVWARGYSENYTDSQSIFGRIGAWIAADNPYNSVVGCVLLRPGDDTRAYPGNYGVTESVIGQIVPTDAGQGSDSNVVATTYVHGVYGFKSLTTTWNSSNADHTIPNSMYLSAKPSWWDAGQWPSNGPDLATKNAGNPAYRRYNAFVAGGSNDYSLLIPATTAPANQPPSGAVTNISVGG